MHNEVSVAVCWHAADGASAKHAASVSEPSSGSRCGRGKSCARALLGVSWQRLRSVAKPCEGCADADRGHSTIGEERTGTTTEESHCKRGETEAGAEVDEREAKPEVEEVVGRVNRSEAVAGNAKVCARERVRVLDTCAAVITATSGAPLAAFMRVEGINVAKLTSTLTTFTSASIEADSYIFMISSLSSVYTSAVATPLACESTMGDRPHCRAADAW